MKKLLGILVLGLLWCNVGVAGCIEGDCYTGQGTYVFEDGGKYVGEFRWGYSHGQGTFTFASGDILKRSIFVGEYINGHSGDGIWTFTNGRVCDSSSGKSLFIDNDLQVTECSGICNYLGCAR